MKITNNIKDAVKKQIINFTCNGKCSNCGECCSDLLPINDDEIRKIKQYIKKHNIKECNHIPAVVRNPLDLTCPFRDNKNKKCLIYEVRPEICRSFICSKSMPEVEESKRLINSTRQVVSMRNIFFNGEPLENVLFKIQIQMQRRIK